MNTQTQTIIEWLESGGYGYTYDKQTGTVTFTGEWCHEWPAFKLDDDAKVERIGGAVYRVRDGDGCNYRLELWDVDSGGGGSNGEIRGEWEDSQP